MISFEFVKTFNLFVWYLSRYSFPNNNSSKRRNFSVFSNQYEIRKDLLFVIRSSEKNKFSLVFGSVKTFFSYEIRKDLLFVDWSSEKNKFSCIFVFVKTVFPYTKRCGKNIFSWCSKRNFSFFSWYEKNNFSKDGKRWKD